MTQHTKLRTFFFGCDQRSGHFLHQPGNSYFRESEGLTLIPWNTGELDGGLCPGGWVTRSTRVNPNGSPAQYYPVGPQVQGQAVLHHRADWTALAFWDRSVDPRSNSCAVFLVAGTHDFDATLALFRESFPQIAARFAFEITHHETHP